MQISKIYKIFCNHIINENSGCFANMLMKCTQKMNINQKQSNSETRSYFKICYI